MDWLRTILWVSVVVATSISVFARWKATSVNKVLGDELLSQTSTPTLAEIEEARAAKSGEGVRVESFELEPSKHSVGKEGAEYFTYDVLTNEKLAYSPTDADIRLFDLGQKWRFWNEVRRFSPIAAAVLLMGALALQFGF